MRPERGEGERRGNEEEGEGKGDEEGDEEEGKGEGEDEGANRDENERNGKRIEERVVCAGGGSGERGRRGRGGEGRREKGRTFLRESTCKSHL